MTEIYAESETQASRRDKKDEGIRPNTDSSEDARGAGEGIWHIGIEPDRENSTAGGWASNPLGGILDQLIDDAQKQLVKSRECIVWYREEEKECEQKLNNLLKLKKLQQLQQQQSQEQQPKTQDYNDHSEESLAE